MKIAEAIGAAFGTFSRIPVPKSAWTDFGSTHALAAFPLVGLAEGFLMTAWGHVANLLGVPATIVAAVLVALPVAVSRARSLSIFNSFPTKKPNRMVQVTIITSMSMAEAPMAITLWKVNRNP